GFGRSCGGDAFGGCGRSCSPRPGIWGRRVGGEGDAERGTRSTGYGGPVRQALLSAEISAGNGRKTGFPDGLAAPDTPSPPPLSPAYRGEGLSEPARVPGWSEAGGGTVVSSGG